MLNIKPYPTAAAILLLTTALANATPPADSPRPVLRPEGLFTMLTPKPIHRPDNLQALLTAESSGPQPEAPQSGTLSADSENAELPPSSQSHLSEGVEEPAPVDAEVTSSSEPQDASHAGDAPVPPVDVDAADGLSSEDVVEPEPEKLQMPPDLALTRYSAENYTEDRARLLGDLTAKSGNIFETLSARLRLGEFQLAHLLVPEGHSVVADIERDALPRDTALELDVVRDGLKAASGEGEPEYRLLDDARYAEWAGYSYWNAIRHLTRSEFEASEPFLAGAFTYLDNQPASHKEAFLKLILEGAIETGQWTLAKEVGEYFDDYPKLKETAAYNFLIGLAAEKIGRDLDAFDAYRLASNGADIYAQRARLGIVQIGLRTGAMPLEDAETFLMDNALGWKGDDLEVQALLDLFNVSMELHKPVEALLALAKVFRAFPESEAAKENAVTARDVFMELYEKGLSGEVSLGEFAASHIKLVEAYRYAPGFHTAHSMYAETLMDSGATSLAAVEYGEIADYLELADELEVLAVEPADILKAKLHQAEALIAGAQYAAALPVLQQPLASDDLDIVNKAQALQIEAFNNTGEDDALLRVEPKEPTAKILRMRADAYATKADWPGVRDALNKLRSEFSDEVTKRDAAQLLLAAHRAGDPETIQSVLEAYPDIFETEAFKSIASGLHYTAAPLEPLKLENAQSRIARAEGAIRDVDETLNSTSH
ncbi:hypothetical protein [Salipiger sp. PrR003]|uniref:hypothetical protein n=1 Tax=Salipiger sp. PrR003 TaxID=2706776 RepID=UPI0013D93EAD|nr:hypothetical protein [Salipiger sp. PrR003]NDV50771.1 hypothetical protein [Salipiger sp. PrR003]